MREGARQIQRGKKEPDPSIYITRHSEAYLMLISISEVGREEKKTRRRENNTLRPRHGDPYENKIQPKWICCNWFQIVRSGER